LVASVLFLEENGYLFGADPCDAEDVFIGVADGSVSGGDLAEWFQRVCNRAG
jgi:hypothetical protein